MSRTANQPPRSISRTGIGAVCVYCGSRPGEDAAHLEAARTLGTGLAERRIDLIFGGGSVGLMGAVADAVMDHGGHATGIITTHLHGIEVGHEALSDLIVVPSMHERKRLMFERADAFIILPGGIGTLDETFEIVTWKQLGLHDKPIILLNMNGYWDPLQDMLAHIVDHGFAHSRMTGLMETVEDVEGIFSILSREAARTHHADSRSL